MGRKRNSFEDNCKLLFDSTSGEFEVVSQINGTRYVIIKHNICGETFEVLFNNFLKRDKYCRVCQPRNFSHEEYVKIISRNHPTHKVMSKYTTMRGNIDIECTICGNKWSCEARNVYSCKKCASLKQTKSDAQYKTELSIANNNIICLETYLTAATPLKHKCLICNYEWHSKPNNILTGYGCPVCGHKIVVKGLNDICTTHSELANMLKNKEDGYCHSYASNNKLLWICPNCGNTISKMPNNVLKYGLSCELCSDTLSFPNKFMANILKACDIKYVAEKYFIWSENKRYDFYLPLFTLIKHDN